MSLGFLLVFVGLVESLMILPVASDDKGKMGVLPARRSGAHFLDLEAFPLSLTSHPRAILPLRCNASTYSSCLGTDPSTAPLKWEWEWWGLEEAMWTFLYGIIEATLAIRSSLELPPAPVSNSRPLDGISEATPSWEQAPQRGFMATAPSIIHMPSASSLSGIFFW